MSFKEVRKIILGKFGRITVMLCIIEDFTLIIRLYNKMNDGTHVKDNDIYSQIFDLIQKLQLPHLVSRDNIVLEGNSNTL